LTDFTALIRLLTATRITWVARTPAGHDIEGVGFKLPQRAKL